MSYIYTGITNMKLGSANPIIVIQFKLVVPVRIIYKDRIRISYIIVTLVCHVTRRLIKKSLNPHI